MNVSRTVLAYFESRGGLPGATEQEKLACHYLDRKVIDSMGILDMIAHLEATFGIEFDADDLQSEQFQTVEGLVRIIERIRGES